MIPGTRSRFAVVLNEAAGTIRTVGSDGVSRAIRAGLTAAGHDVHISVTRPDGFDAAFQSACESDADVVVAGGGDGTLSHAAAMAARFDKVLGVLPLGTVNLFTRDLGMPADLDEAVAALATAPVRAIDLGEVNGRTFLIHASLGVYPWIVRRREQRERQSGYGRWPAMFMTSLQALFRYPLLRCELEHEGLKRRVRTPLIMVTCNPVAEGRLLHRQVLDGGQLVLYLGRRGGVAGLAHLAFDAALGWWHESGALETVHVQRLTIDSKHRRLPIAIDGEVESIATPLRYRIRPGALKILRPEPG